MWVEVISAFVATFVLFYAVTAAVACRSHMTTFRIDQPFLRSWWRFMAMRDIRTGERIPKVHG